MSDRSIRHLALIMDGNGRWATERGLSRSAGHRAGVENIIPIITACFKEHNIPVVSLFCFSTENWARPRDEIRTLFTLLRRFFQKNLFSFIKNNVRIKVSGLLDDRRIPRSILTVIDEAQARTVGCHSHVLNILFNYGSRAEIAQAVRESAAQLIRDPKLDPKALLESHLLTADLPDVDLLIRTSGEMRLSNCLLYQCAYAELIFPSVYWPDFSEENLRECIEEYCRRDRRFGGIVQAAEG